MILQTIAILCSLPPNVFTTTSQVAVVDYSHEQRIKCQKDFLKCVRSKEKKFNQIETGAERYRYDMWVRDNCQDNIPTPENSKLGQLKTRTCIGTYLRTVKAFKEESGLEECVLESK